MLDAKSLLDQFLGQAGQAKRGIDGLGGTGGLAVGGVLGLLLANKKARKMAGNVAVYGGAAALGLLAWRAYRNWQDGQKPASGPVAQPGDMPQVAPKYLPSAAPAADGNPFELALVRAMISAAKADGHLDATEQQRVFAEIERMALDAEAKSTVFAMLANPVRLEEIVASAGNEEQAAELYLASRLAIDPDQPAEREYLSLLATRLHLPPDLRAHLDAQVEAALTQKTA